MEILFNTSLITLAFLVTLSVWGMVGAVILSIIVADFEVNPEALISALLWPIVLVFAGMAVLIEWMKKQ